MYHLARKRRQVEAARRSIVAVYFSKEPWLPRENPSRFSLSFLDCVTKCGMELHLIGSYDLRQVVENKDSSKNHV